MDLPCEGEGPTHFLMSVYLSMGYNGLGPMSKQIIYKTSNIVCSSVETLVGFLPTSVVRDGCKRKKVFKKFSKSFQKVFLKQFFKSLTGLLTLSKFEERYSSQRQLSSKSTLLVRPSVKQFQFWYFP